MDLSVVIVNYNTRERLLTCLATLRPELAGLQSEVFVVDNGSDDGSPDAVRRHFPEVRITANADNRGFGRANNQAFQEARGDDVLLLNPDTEVTPGAVGILRAALHELPNAVAVGPKVMRPNGQLDLSCRRSFPRPGIALARFLGLSRAFPRSRRFARYNLTYQDPDVPGEIDAGTAAAMCFRRDALVAVRFFDEAFFMYGEDLDLCFRLKERGGRIYYVPAAVIIHHKGESTRLQAAAMLREFDNAMWIFFKKHYMRGWRRILAPPVWTAIQLRHQIVRSANAIRGRQVVSP